MKKQTITFMFGSLLAILLLHPGKSTAQSETSFNSGVDIMSRYIWRGMNLGGSSPSIQPTLEYSLAGFTLGSWGAFSMSDGLKIQETDLYLSYDIKDLFSVMITDYFLPVDTLENNNYFEYNEEKTSHLLEFSASFNGTEKIPFTFMAAVNFWGADALKFDGKKQYSTYLEVGYNGTCKDVDYNIFLGFTPTNPDQEKGETGFYGPYAGVINCGITASKAVQITDKFSLPVTTSFIVNPQAENVFLVVGISL